MSKRWLLLAALAGCTAVEAQPSKDYFSVDLSAVTLGDDCTPPPPPAPANPKPPAKPSSRTPSTPSVAAPPADCATPNCGSYHRCEQTTMQLSIKAPAGIQPTKIKIKKIELLDSKGKVLEVLTSKSPTKWDGSSSYITWNESIAAGESVKAMYNLTAPNWNKLTNGRWNAHSKTFQLRVTVTIGTANKTVEKQSITATQLPPPVPT
jgi:hypothetical protein